jgi:hypothetical protein
MNTKKMRKEGKPHGKHPPLTPSKYNASKMKKERKTNAKKLCPSLQGDLTNVQVYAL